MNLRHSIALLIASVLSACSGADSPSPTHRPESVDIQRTPVRTQGRFGICWAYGITGLIESVQKSTSGTETDLSEEAIAFYFLAYEILDIIKHEPITERLSRFMGHATSGGIPDGWTPRHLPISDPRAAQIPDGLEIVKRHGVVPESAWSFKIADGTTRDQLFRSLGRKALQLSNSVSQADVTLTDVIEKVMVGEGAFPKAPPTEFEWNGETITATDFLKSTGFDSDAFGVIAAYSAKDYEKVVTATKRALARGLLVPIGFPINLQLLKGDTFTAAGLPMSSKEDISVFMHMQAGHLVLASDFVNVGSSEGALPGTDLQREVERPASELDYLVLKNSWGVGAKENELGQVIATSPTGYYRMDRSYLQGSAQVGGYQEWVYMPLHVVVPRDIVRDLLQP